MIRVNISLDLCTEKGASNWVSARLLSSLGFHIHKSALEMLFTFAMDGRSLTDCTCGQCFSLEHALSCPAGGFPSIRHNEVRDITATLLFEACTNVEIEPHLQPLTGEHFPLRTANSEQNARLDVVVNGVWGGRFERTFFDVRNFVCSIRLLNQIWTPLSPLLIEDTRIINVDSMSNV